MQGNNDMCMEGATALAPALQGMTQLTSLNLVRDARPLSHPALKPPFRISLTTFPALDVTAVACQSMHEHTIEGSSLLPGRCTAMMLPR